MANKILAFVLPAALVISSANALTPAQAKQTSSAMLGAGTGYNETLAHEITQLFNEDQAMIGDLERARQDAAFEKTYQAYAQRVEAEVNDPNFFLRPSMSLGPKGLMHPELFVAMPPSTNPPTHVSSPSSHKTAGREEPPRGTKPRHNSSSSPDMPMIKTRGVSRSRRPSTKCFGRNMSRHECMPTSAIASRMLQASRRSTAPLCPNPATPGAAKLYRPLSGTIDATDKRRAQIGLPSIEDDLEKFRQGATIGPYMTPLTKGMQWTIADVYTSSS
jgi:hypothetical protein